MEINQEELKIWIAALRSGNYIQNEDGPLQNKYGYCSLGVGCKVLIPRNKLIFNPSGFIAGGYVGSQEFAPEWFKKINVYHEKKFGKKISQLNDDDKLTFEEIADILEKSYLTKK